MKDPDVWQRLALDLDLAPDTFAPENFEAHNDFLDWQRIALSVGKTAQTQRCRVIGISGAQGSGKSTLANLVAAELGTNAGVVSLDDYYLTKAERLHLAETVHPLLATRGVPGTHDVAWLAETLAAAQAEGTHTCSVPRFDKGLDDRAGSQEIGCQPLVLEGWAVGAPARDDASLQVATNDLEAGEDPDGIWRRWVNAQIEDAYLPLWEQVDYWIHLRPPSFAQVYEWRWQQEQAIDEHLRMSQSTLERFIQHYEGITLSMWRTEPQGPGLVAFLDADHTVDRVQILTV